MKKLLFILPFIILFSCTVQKRKYQKGFYVSTHKIKMQTKKENQVFVAKNVKPETLAQKAIESVHPVSNSIQEEASAENKFTPLKASRYPSLLTPPDSCDVIILKNGDEVKAKVLEITPIEIKYRKYGVTDGPLYVASKSDVFMIKYQNGTKEVINKQNSESFQSYNPSSNNTNSNSNRSNVSKQPKKPKQVHPFGLLSLILGCVSFLAFYISAVISISGAGLFLTAGIYGFAIAAGLALIAIILGSLAKKNIEQYPERYKGKGLAMAGKIIGIVMLSIIAFIFLITILVV